MHAAHVQTGHKTQNVPRFVTDPPISSSWIRLKSITKGVRAANTFQMSRRYDMPMAYGNAAGAAEMRWVTGGQML